MVEYSDEFFINLIMDYDERDEELYSLWSVWCAKSEYKYFIDGTDHHFYTHIRTEKEIVIEKKKKEILDYLETIKEVEHYDEYREILYYQYLTDLCNEENILEITPKTFKEWLEDQQF